MDLNDRKAWDDSDLINTWDEALEEYKKYHSIHASGKRLEDVLTKEEMAKVIAQRRELRKGKHDRKLMRYEDDHEDEEAPEEENAEHDMSMSSPERDVPIEVALTDVKQESAMEPEPPMAPTNGPTTANPHPSMPLMTVQDEGLKNLLMAWYYAGYHTGLYEGRQQGLKEATQETIKP